MRKPVRAVKLNVINEPKDSYTGGKSSLCPGCGHDQISSVIVNAAWDNGIEPHRIAKMSGIGCSSKTPAYYLGQSHGFNTVHGRMPSVTTGANVVNNGLTYLGVSGDGDSASIGIGQLIHAIRRKRGHGLHRRKQRCIWTDKGTILCNSRCWIQEEERCS